MIFAMTLVMTCGVAALAAWAATTEASSPADKVIPRPAKKLRSFSSARVTRFFAASSLTPLLRADGTTGDKTGGAKQPTGEHHAWAKSTRLASQQNEHRLRHLLRQLRVTHVTHGDGIHQIDVAVDQRAEGCFRIPLNV